MAHSRPGAHFMSYLRFVIKDASFGQVLCHLRINDSIVSMKVYSSPYFLDKLKRLMSLRTDAPLPEGCVPLISSVWMVYDSSRMTRRQLNVLNYGTDSAQTREPEIASNARYVK